MRALLVTAIVFEVAVSAHAQALLEADGPGNTYELINSVLAPGNNAVEDPDASHPAFGRHIAEVWDSTLNRYVFEFTMHVTPDDDRGINFDRQRIEIKTYEPSPDSLKGVIGETVIYRWKFRINTGYRPSSSFTHLHQIKPVGGDDGNPLFTLTPRKGTPNKMELIHNNTTKVAIVELSLFEGVWVECTEVVTIDSVNGSYSMMLKKVSDGTTILSYSNPRLMTIRPSNTFIRPKWGIYRSLNVPSDLRDEAVRFAGFSVGESKGPASGVADRGALPSGFSLTSYPNPFNPATVISFQLPAPSPERSRGAEGPVASQVRLVVYDLFGREVERLVDERRPAGTHQVQWDASRHASGSYFCRLSVIPSDPLLSAETSRGGIRTETLRMLLVK